MSVGTLALSVDPLTPVRSTLAAMAADSRQPPTTGLAPNLTVSELTTWTPATALTSGVALDALLDTAKQRWRATPHAAAALAWKCYSYWVALPAVLGYAAARRVPLVRPESVVAHWSPQQPFVRVGLTSAQVAVLPSDPLALLSDLTQRRLRVTVVPDEAALIGAMRSALIDDHLGPIVDRIHDRVHVGRRTLWGSVAAGIAHGLSRAADAVPGPILATAEELLSGLGLDDLVDLTMASDGRPGLEVQRRTCCLAFTLPEAKICSGCCIR